MFGSDSNNDQKGSNFQPPPAAAPTSPPPSAVPRLSDAPPFFDSPLNSNSPAPAPTDYSTPVAAPNDDSLMDIKQQALASLTPLVGQIDQTPEEKFKTTMMLIQASDNASLIKEAYATANQITDEKARAQALIDVINEINYFTQKSAKNS